MRSPAGPSSTRRPSWGGALFYGVTDPSGVTVSLAPVLAYTAAHLVAFLAGATVAAAIAMALSLLWMNPPLQRELREREYRDS